VKDFENKKLNLKIEKLIIENSPNIEEGKDFVNKINEDLRKFVVLFIL
jgi:uncharacterized protein YktB (UPF0637 family)